MTEENAKRLLTALLSIKQECEWLEFKENNQSPEIMGERISALSNMACLSERSFGYLVYGISDKDRSIVGTTFRFNDEKMGNQVLKIWLENLVEPRLSVLPLEVEIEGKKVLIIRIPAAKNSLTTFKGSAYCRVGSATPKLSSRPDIEKALQMILNRQTEEDAIVKQDCDENEVFSLLDIPSYYDALNLPLPNKDEMIRKFVEESFLIKEDHGGYSITLLGALCFAKSMHYFPFLSKRSVRLVSYNGETRLDGNDEQIFDKGYVLCFNEIISAIIHLYRREAFSGPRRINIDPYSEIALREALANMIIHGDLNANGSGPLIEAFPNRLEFSNPGTLRFEIDRILDVSPDAKNHALADFMHRLGIGDERGSGYDKMLIEAERLIAPSPLVENNSNGVRVTLFPPIKFEDESSSDIRRDIYLHCCLRYLNRTPMNNTSVRMRFGLDERKTTAISKWIKVLVDENRIKPIEGASRKKMEYIPYWA